MFSQSETTATSMDSLQVEEDPSTSNQDALPSPPPPPSQIPPLSWPETGNITQDWIQNLISTFEWSSKFLKPTELPSVLPVSVFGKLILTASKFLHKEPNCVTIMFMVHDVIFLLNHAGLPSDNRFFVFNGDYVDRGAWGLETFLLLLAWNVFLPHRVFLLRGNHESKYCTSVYGFEQEVMAKYGSDGKHVYRKCLGCFVGLPLASIIAGCVYTAHGGLFRGTPVTPSKRPKGNKGRKIVLKLDSSPLTLGSLEELAKARRSVLDPPWEGLNLIPGDVLWSDPSMKPGLSPNTERGIGLIWGPDCTEEFLKKYNLKCCVPSTLQLIIRSHEGPDARVKRPGLLGMGEGYTIDHEVESGKLITIFSAPDYPQFQATEERFNNKGAYIVLEGPNFDTPVFHSFEAVVPRPKANAFYNYVDAIDSEEELDLPPVSDLSS
ncbi:hypothetical protein MKX01_019256 [Papaver californicum]|nr:hypothetical protein MKX01_019256 [Papaver californicum]